MNRDNILYYLKDWPVYELSYSANDVRIPEFKRDIITPPGAFQHFTHALLHSESITDIEKYRLSYKNYPHRTPEFNFKPDWKFLKNEHDGKIIRFQTFQFHKPANTPELNEYRLQLHNITYKNVNIIPNEYTLNPLHIPYVYFMDFDDFDYEIIRIFPYDKFNWYTLYCLAHLKYYMAWGGKIDKAAKPFLYEFNPAEFTLTYPKLARQIHKYKRTKIIKEFSWESLFLDIDLGAWEELFVLTGKQNNYKKIKNDLDFLIKTFIFDNTVLVESLSNDIPDLIPLLKMTTKKWLY